MHSMHLVVLVTFLWPFLCTAVSFRSNSVCKGDLYSLPRTVEDQGTGEQRAWHPLGCCTGAMWGVLKEHRGPWGWRFPVWDSPLLLSSSFKGKPSLLFIFNEEGETQVLEGPYQHVLSEHLGTSCWEFLSRCICCLPLIWENGPWARILVSSETGMHWMFAGMTQCLSAVHHQRWMLHEQVRGCQEGSLGLIEGGWLAFTDFRGIWDENLPAPADKSALL